MMEMTSLTSRNRPLYCLQAARDVRELFTLPGSGIVNAPLYYGEQIDLLDEDPGINVCFNEVGVLEAW